MFGVDDALIGAAIGGISSIFTNEKNSQNVAATNAANARLAQENRDFQERMSNTAYQRGMEDMKKAGLNPILAYQKGPASSPTGGAATAQSFEAKNPGADAVNTALALSRSRQEIANMKATEENTRQETAKSISEENMNKVKLQILGEELSPAQLRKVIADQDKSVYQTSAGAIARKAGTIAQEAERTVAPILNSAKSFTDAVKPWRSYKTETTRSGSRWNSSGEENHYQDTTFSKRWP